MTKIFHPNVSEKGEICVNTLKKDWNPAAWSIYNILEVYILLSPLPFRATIHDGQPQGWHNEKDHSEYGRHMMSRRSNGQNGKARQ